MALSNTFHRKYRPKRFAEFVGQGPIVLALRNALKTGRVGQSYLFAGPRGVGKTSMARLLAQAVNCLKLKDGEPCGTCPICQAFEANASLDLIEIDAASHTQVEHVRELIDKVHLAPALGRFKVYVIDEAQMLSRSAFNALLKTLEEPPSHVIFVLATTEPSKLPPTIISRCQRFDFGYIATEEITGQLVKVAKKEKLSLKRELLAVLAEQAQGGLRDALGLLEQVSHFGEVSEEELRQFFGLVGEEVLEELTASLIRRDVLAALKLIHQTFQRGLDLLKLVQAWGRYLRNLLLVKLRAGGLLDLTAAARQRLLEQAKEFELQELSAIIAKLFETELKMKSSSSPLLLLEILLVELVGGGQGGSHPPSSREPNEEREAGGEVREANLAERDELILSWAKIVREVADRRPSLAVLLRSAQVEWLEGVLQLTLSSRFALKMLKKEESLLKKALLTVAGKEFLLRFAFNEQVRPALRERAFDSIMGGEKGREEVPLDEIKRVFGQV